MHKPVITMAHAIIVVRAVGEKGEIKGIPPTRGCLPRAMTTMYS